MEASVSALLLLPDHDQRYSKLGVGQLDGILSRDNLAYDTRYADLLFEVVTRRYQQHSIVLRSNKVFGEWNDVFPNAACVVTLVDPLVHCPEIVPIEGESNRLNEAKERAAAKGNPIRTKGQTQTPMNPALSAAHPRHGKSLHRNHALPRPRQHHFMAR